LVHKIDLIAHDAVFSFPESNGVFSVRLDAGASQPSLFPQVAIMV